MQTGRARLIAEFIVLNFTPPIAFFVVFAWRGARPAIGVAMGAAIVQWVLHWVLRQRISAFFVVASVFTIVFGGMDFLVREPRYFRLEPFAENAFLGLVFLATVLVGKPIVLWFAQSLPQGFRPALGENQQSYLRAVTLAWVAYFFAKGLLFLYLGLTVNLGELIVLRSVIGSVTLAMMFAGEYFYRTRIRAARARPRKPS